MKHVNFMLGIHNHQPVGNFPEVFEKAYQDSYLPFAEALFKHPGIRWSLHCTGILWDFFADKHPEYIEMVRTMVDRGQVELLTGGYYEPIMSVIPDGDKRGQIEKQTAFLKKTFGVQAKGMWLAERVWEPGLAKQLADAGIAYTVVDDAHFSATGMDPDALRGYYVTEEQGVKLNIFPISQKLRYHIPFKTIDETIHYFGTAASEHGEPSLVMADDGEKFGLWPDTFKHVYQDKWLERFLQALESHASWLHTVTFADYLEKNPPSGRVYLPTASYFEMSEWSLPAASQEQFEDVVKSLGDHSPVTRFLKGGFWRNFLTKYSESNNMHKKMLYVSEQVAAARAKGVANAESAGNHLYAGQCNCAYWHGVFGGLYLPHLRNAVYRELLSAEALLRESDADVPRWVNRDFDADGTDEILHEGKHQNLYFAPHRGGVLFEWDLLDPKINLLNTLTRRQEAYHKRLREFIANPAPPSGGVKTIHDMVKVKEGNLDKYLSYDWYRRESFIDHFILPGTSYEDFRKCQYGEQGDFVLNPYAHKTDGYVSMARTGRVWVGDRSFGIRVVKKIVPQETQVKVHYSIENLEDAPAPVSFAPEMNFAFSYFDENNAVDLKRAREWSFRDEPFGIEVTIQFSEDARVWVFPVQTVSLSEAGFEKTYQGTSVTPVFALTVPPHASYELDIIIKLRKSHH